MEHPKHNPKETKLNLNPKYNCKNEMQHLLIDFQSQNIWGLIIQVCGTETTDHHDVCTVEQPAVLLASPPTDRLVQWYIKLPNNSLNLSFYPAFVKVQLPAISS